MKPTTPLPFDPRSPEFIANPYPTYEYLRNNHPIYYRPEQKDWVLTRYADITQVLKDPSFARSEKNKFLQQVPIPNFNNRLLELRYESQKLMTLFLVLLNAPEHTKIRNLLKIPFTPSRIKLLKSHLEETINCLIDRVKDRGKMDIVADLAYPLTLGINLKILGIPPTEWHPNFKQWADSLSGILDLDITPISNEKGLFAVAGLAQYFRNWISKCRHDTHLQQQDNLINILIKAEAKNQISEEELLASCIFMFAAGHSTNANFIGTSILTLLKNPEQLELLKADRSLIKSAMAEIIRYDTPAQAIFRTVSADIQLSNQIIRQGEKVNCIIAAANRDPEQFVNPEKFDITRNPNPYISFGQGIHNCIGRHLVMFVAETTLPILLDRLPNLSLENESLPLEWDDYFVTRGLKELIVKF